MKSHQLSAVSFQLGLWLLAASCWADEAPNDLGANVSVVVEPDGSTTVDVKRGAGESVYAQKGKPLKRTLRAPETTAPADGATLNATDVTLAWQKVPGAARYLVEISATPELSASRTQTVDTSRAVVHVEPGTWYWRVVALDGSGSPGRRATARRLTIDVTPPKLKTGKPEWK
jgi:hypothetical protein